MKTICISYQKIHERIKNYIRGGRKDTVSRKKSDSSSDPPKLRPALTPEARENQLISLAYDRAEEKLLNGTASSQLITHFLKLGSAKERLERDSLEQDIQLKKAKTESLKQNQTLEEVYKKAIIAMRDYSGNGSMGDEEYFDL